MKITLFLSFACVFSLLANNTYSQQTNFSFNLKNVTLAQLFTEIENESEYVFLVNDNANAELSKKVSVYIENGNIFEVLDAVMKERSLSYVVTGRQISVYRKKRENPVNNVIPNPEPEQQRKIVVTGLVTTDLNEPLVGVTVRENNTQTGTFTDENGKYVIEVSNAEAELIFSYIGFKTQKISIKGKTEINLKMEEDISTLKDVVVTVGYGTQTKVSITGAVSSVTSDDIRKSSSTSFGNALQGRITGLSSTQSGGGAPGLDDAEIYLRGAATTNGKSPLILVDGVPRDLRTLDVTEVESVSVLKDASATAVFGVRGANGVIIVTTKRGVAGKAQLSVSASQVFTSLTRKPPRLSALEFIDLRNEAYKYSNEPEMAFSPEVRAKFENPLLGLNPNDPDYAQNAANRKHLYPDHYYYDDFFKDYAPETRINANIQGGTEKVLYFMNVGYLHQGGHLKTEPKSKLGYDPSLKLDRWSFRANMDYNMTSWLKAKLNIGTYIEKQNSPNYRPFSTYEEFFRGIIQEVYRLNPTIIGPTTIAGIDETTPANAVINTGPRVGGDRSVYGLINRNGYYVDTRTNLNTSIEMEMDLSEFVTKGLSLKGMIAYDSYPTSSLLGQRDEIQYFADPDYSSDKVIYSRIAGSENPMSLSRWSSSRYQINAQASINYSRKFGDHSVGGMFVVQRDHWESSGAEIPYNMLGLAGRATYNYKSRYFAEFNIGYNGSEQFAPANRYGTFPAFSVGWVVSNEKFLAENKYLTYLKLRASYGKVGNDKLGGSRFLYQDDIKLVGQGTTVGGVGLGQQVSTILLGNHSLQWEVADKYNFGVDFQITNNLTGAFDYFRENRSKILITRNSVPMFQGVSQGALPKANLGKAENKGIEFELAYSKQLSNDWHLRVKGNIATNKNKITAFDEVPADDSYAYQYRTTGYAIDQNWGLKVDKSSPGKGYWTSQEEIDASGLTYEIGNPRPGDLKYQDLNGDNLINSKDYAPIGNSGIPGLTYGLDVNVTFKGFDLSVFFSGVGKYSTIWNGLGIYETEGTGTYYEYHKNAWTPERYASGAKITYPTLSKSNGSNHVPNDFFLQDRSFIRLKNLEFGYTIPKNTLKVIGVSELRLYVTGQNLFLWDKLTIKHQDPEKTDPRRYPITKLMGFGLNVTF
ncbi:TonB-dependent receptor [Dysgonomonas sp. 521]|uniref:SusC/RagA family TonB-linked outer membrane protein n=1 Tax=Dysgonomonas sp. 521 TaxID=2302932 RepID=UPI0013D2FFF5|nr:TonB-dependent receptor [Dysgonomonas sp. 521]